MRGFCNLVYPLRPRCARPPLPKGEAKGGCRERQFLTYIYQISRERSKKTEGVFLVGSRRSGGKSKSLRARFLLPAFSFGEAKENADGQLQICTVYQPFERLLETPEASPMRGRWHGGAVTDEVGQFRLRSTVHLISRLAATASPHRGSHCPLRRANLSGASRQLPLTRGASKKPPLNKWRCHAKRDGEVTPRRV